MRATLDTQAASLPAHRVVLVLFAVLVAGCQPDAPVLEVAAKVAPVATKPVRPHRPLPRVPLTDEQAFRMFRAAPGIEDFEGKELESPEVKKNWAEWVRVADILAEMTTDRLDKLTKRSERELPVWVRDKGFWLNRWVSEVPERFPYEKIGSVYLVAGNTQEGALFNPLFPFAREQDGGLRLATNGFGYSIRGLPPYPSMEFLAFRELFPRRKLPVGLAPDIECRERVVR